MDERVHAYLEMLFKWNRAVNLTAFESADEAMREGVLPSLAACNVLPQGASVLDIGSGGGFPAIPLAMERQDLSFVLAEPSQAKAVFLREAAWHFGLRIEVEAQVADALLSRGGKWDVVTVRGVHLRRGLIRRIQRGLAPGGMLLIWTGGDRRADYQKWLEADGWAVEPLPGDASATTVLRAVVPRGTS